MALSRRCFATRWFLNVALVIIVLIASKLLSVFICQRLISCPKWTIVKAVANVFSRQYRYTVQGECHILRQDLIGTIEVKDVGEHSWSSIEQSIQNVEHCGQFHPKHCRTRHKVGILVPFKDRESHLKSFTNHIHPFLQKQNLNYRIYIINQAHPEKFNRGKLFNVGFVEALKDYDWDCFIFHDVDLLPEDDRNLYSCSKLPKHMSVATSKTNYRLPYNQYIGGVLSMTKEHIFKVNGFSNKYWGWGGEDDDIYYRISNHRLRNRRINQTIGRYTALQHEPAEKNKQAGALVKQLQKSKQTVDGLVNLRYHLISMECSKLYTNLTVNLDP